MEPRFHANNIIMLQKITKTPTKYYQLFLLNVGLVVALCKGMTLLSIVSSFAFVALALAPAAIYFGVLSPPPHQVLLDEVGGKLRECHKLACEWLGRWREEEAEKKVKLPIKVPSA